MSFFNNEPFCTLFPPKQPRAARARGRRAGFRLAAALAVLPFCAVGQTLQTVNTSSLSAGTRAYSIVERGPNHKVWASAVTLTNAAGEVSVRTNRYVELATGMHVQNSAGNYVDSSEQIQITAAGAQATNAPHQAFFSADIHTAGAISLVTPEGKKLTSNPLFLSYLDTSTGTNVMIAQITNSIGQLVASNQVLYPAAFDGEARIDLLYTFKKSGFSQDLVCREQLPPPSAWGLDDSSTKLQIWTEFLSLPTVQIAQGTNANGTVVDREISFGQSKIGQGRAFLMGDEAANSKSVRVDKHWVNFPDTGRCFLVEEVQFASLQARMETLPAPKANSGTNQQANLRVGQPWILVAGRAGGAGPKLPPRLLAGPLGGKMKVAKSNGRRDASPTLPKVEDQGFVLDYVVLNSSTSPFTFLGNTTYYVSASVNLSTVYIEGGAVIKFAPGTSINVGTAVNCLTGPYRKAVLTAVDDNNYGQVISGSSGSPSGPNYGSPTLNLGNLNGTLHDLRFGWAAQALAVGGGEARNVEFINCQEPIISQYYINFYNVLAQNFDVFLQSPNQGSSIFQNVTLHTGNTLAMFDMTYPWENSVDLVNTLLVGLVNDPTQGDTNGNPSFTTLEASSRLVPVDTGPFVSSTYGDHYLPANSPYRGIGTTAIDAALLASLGQKTTQVTAGSAPTSWAGLQVSTVIGPVTPRYTGGNPDIGYWYDAMDYSVNGINASGSGVTVTLTNGVALGLWGYNGSSGGMRITSGAQFISQGTPQMFNHIVNLGGGVNQFWVSPSLCLLRFTDLVMGCGDGTGNLIQGFGTLQMSDCQMDGGWVSVSGFSATVKLKNNLFLDAQVSLTDANSVNMLTVGLNNNLFKGGAVTISHGNNGTGAPTWNVNDNYFDLTTMSGGGGGGSGPILYDYNAYQTGSSRLTPTQTHDVILSTEIAFQSGPLGTYYQPSTSVLYGVGSQSAAAAGLYHYTVRVDQAKEANAAKVTIGLHYVALVNGKPANFTGNGLPDYLADSNGNGVFDVGDFANWLAWSTLNDGIPDGWKVQYGFSPTDNTVASADPDGDGLSNLWEYVLGTNPLVNQSLDPASRRNYNYDLLNRLTSVTGEGKVTLTPDKEGNIKNVTP